MNILVDYHNIPRAERAKGIQAVAEAILHCLPDDTLPDGDRVRVRLYSGWYERRTFSREAQTLSSTLQSLFPTVLVIGSGLAKRRLTVDVQLAYAIETHPNLHLFNTFRREEAPSGIKSRDAAAVGCTLMPCALAPLAALINGAKCPEGACAKSKEDFLFRLQQKLVDTMIAVDLAFHSGNSAGPVAIVSSDNDFFPAIMYATALGGRVVQVHTRPGGTPSIYRSLLPPAYREVQL